jgi:hypothetical protein
MKSKIKNIITGLCNLWKWRKVIYKDRDWDHYYIYEILRTKLKFQAEHFKKYGITESAEEKANQMLECVDLIDKVKNEYYLDLGVKGLLDNNWTNEQFDEMLNKHDETEREIFDKIKNNINTWWD